MSGCGAPTMNVEIRRASTDDRPAISRMLELYQHDLSDIWDQDLDANGEYGYSVDRYWQDSGCHPFVAVVGGRYAGFALVDGAVKVGAEGHWMDQFFVLRKYRRQGIGATLATHVFARLPGMWEVGQMPRNAPARLFWRSVVSAYAQGAFTEHPLTGGGWEGWVQRFASTSNVEAKCQL